jgi:hypothetical protein
VKILAMEIAGHDDAPLLLSNVDRWRTLGARLPVGLQVNVEGMDAGAQPMPPSPAR